MFSGTARDYGCDRRVVAKWWHRLKTARKTPKGIREALSDRPRSGCPLKISKKMLEEAQKWCKGRAFGTVDLSGVRLSDFQVRRYMRK